MPDMGFGVDRWATKIDADFGRFNRLKYFFCLGESVVDAKFRHRIAKGFRLAVNATWRFGIARNRTV